MRTYNIYCDESGHLKNDKLPSIALGAVWCLKDKRLSIAENIRNIKSQHSLATDF